jgi:hypothetical protein
VLEAILFRRRGPLRTACGACEGRAEWRVRLASLASRNARCPAEGAGAAGPGGGDLAARALAPTPGATPAGGAAPPPAGGGPRVDGAFFLTYRSEGGGAGGIATVWPWRSAFLRLGGEATPAALAVSERSAVDRGNARLLWGFGWDDWHGNTLSLTVHNWGPVRPDEAPNWRGAEANLGYKLPRLCAAPLCIGSIAAVTVPFNGGPYGDFRVTFTLWEKWFVMGGVGRVFPSDVFPAPSGLPRWRVVYGFGRWDWRPGTFYLTYYDWGPNEQARNGVLSVGVNWRV